MPSVTLNLYDTFRQRQVGGVDGLDMESLNLYCMIVTSGYSLNQNTHAFRDDLGANEVSGTGYTAGGNLCDNPTVTMDGNGLVTVDFDDPDQWDYDEAGFTNGDRAIFYINRGGASDADELVGFTNSMGGVGNGNGDFSVTINEDGLYTSAR